MGALKSRCGGVEEPPLLFDQRGGGAKGSWPPGGRGEEGRFPDARPQRSTAGPSSEPFRLDPGPNSPERGPRAVATPRGVREVGGGGVGPVFKAGD